MCNIYNFTFDITFLWAGGVEGGVILVFKMSLIVYVEKLLILELKGFFFLLKMNMNSV